MRYLVALLTPFDARGAIDAPRLRDHVLWLCEAGVDGFVPTGTTGEFLFLELEERQAILRIVIDAAGGRPVYPCTWAPRPRDAFRLGRGAKDAGATGLLMPPPLYYSLDGRAVAGWLRLVADQASLPILGYHNPSYIPSPISESLYAELLADGTLAGLKDSSRDLHRLGRLASEHPDSVYAGGDAILAGAGATVGLAGFISALGNLWPRFCLRLFKEGAQTLEPELLERLRCIKQAGGVPAMKALLGMGCRSPLLPPVPSSLRSIADPERPR